MIKVVSLTFLFVCAFSSNIWSQYSTKKVKSKNEAYTDSLKSIEYDRILPIWGAGAYKEGFDIPYPVGVMGNFIWIKQGITIDNMQLGLKTDTRDIPLTPVDFIGFGENVNTSFSTNIRPDVWIFPFINVYGLFGVGRTHTEVNLVAPIHLKSVVEQGITTAGFGVMGAGGIGPVWISVDANFTWNKPELLEEATQVNVLGMRMGHSFVFKHRPDQNINVWVGTMRVHMASETRGALALKDAIPQETWDRKDEIVTNYYDWYNNEASLAEKKIADEILTPVVEKIDEADGDALIRYGMDKQTKELWNGVVGIQYQMNKAWQLRTELGLFGDRKSYLVSLNYRILGPKKKQ